LNNPDGSKLGLQFVVHDTGIGMSKEQLAGLFKPFKQIDGSITRKYGGTGLGLALTKKLVELMGGKIYISSTENEGTDVSFTIFVETAAKPRAVMGIPQLQGMRVLLVDDNEAARQVISGMLGSLKLKAHAVESAKLAYAELAAAEKRKRPYKLLLLDWRMPEINGLEAARHIRDKLGLLECPPMILVTAFGKSEINFSQKEYGFSSIIYKPVSPSQLLNAILEALEVTKLFAETVKTGSSPYPERFDNGKFLPDPAVVGKALPDMPGFNAKIALEHLWGNMRLYYTLARQFCAKHGNDDSQMAKAVSYGAFQEVAQMARSIKGLSATLGADGLSVKASRIEDFLTQGKEPDDEFYWLFDGFCAEFSSIVGMFRQALQLNGLKIAADDTRNTSKGGMHSAAAGLPEKNEEQPPGLNAQLAEPAEHGLTNGTPGTGAEDKKICISAEIMDILLDLKMKMEDDDASALLHLQHNIDTLSREIPAPQLRKLTQAVEVFDYDTGLENIELLLSG
jgi:CheY-like chemotaxis protein/HPt (histidine-containing phosphotransfer) domain-containing protein